MVMTEMARSSKTSSPARSRLGWFVVLYLVGVAAVAIVAVIVRLLLSSALPTGQ
jgi:hypothetical protein